MLSRGAAIAILVVIGLFLTTAGILIGIHIHKSDVKPGPQPNCPKPGPQPNCPKPDCLKPTFPCTCSTHTTWGKYKDCIYGDSGREFTDLLCTNWNDKQLYNNETDKLVQFARMKSQNVS